MPSSTLYFLYWTTDGALFLGLNTDSWQEDLFLAVLIVNTVYSSCNALFHSVVLIFDQRWCSILRLEYRQLARGPLSSCPHSEHSLQQLQCPVSSQLPQQHWAISTQVRYCILQGFEVIFFQIGEEI